MNDQNIGVLNNLANNEAKFFDAPFSVPKQINAPRVVRYQKSNNAQFHFLSTIRMILVITPFLIIIWILIAATSSIIISHDTSRYSLVILVLDFFIIAFATGCTLEFHDIIKTRRNLNEKRVNK
jgi:hypothetical protein